jgi:hypothetical protein
MPIALSLAAALCLVLGVLWALLARTSAHEVQGLLLILTSAVLASGAAIVAAINRLRDAVTGKPRIAIPGPGDKP